MDHFTIGRTMMEPYLNGCCPPSLVADILKEVSISLRASEIFAIWTPEIRRNVDNMAEETLKDQKNKTSEIDRDARVCFALLMAQSDLAKATKFLNVSRKIQTRFSFIESIVICSHSQMMWTQISFLNKQKIHLRNCY